MATANAMRAVFPQDAALCRMGGDEFVAAFVGEQVGMVDELVGRFAVDDVTYEHEGARHRLTISVGYATYPDQAADRDELYARADAALYAVKRAGKSGVRRYSPEMD